MENHKFLSELYKVIDEKNVKFDESLKKYSSFNIGGNCDFIISPESYEELGKAIKFLNDRDIKWDIIGKGSNILFTDKGYRGVLIRLGPKMACYSVDTKKETIVAGCGMSLAKLSNIALENEFEGLEFANGIPGSLGGAVFMNAGAYGGEMKQVLKQVRAFNDKGEIITITNEQLKLKYRESVFQRNELYAFEATIQLKKGKYDEIKKLIEEFNFNRKSKQPLEYPSCGSTFKRPEGYYAGKLIMDANLRGKKIGGAMVSEKHCGFVVNAEKATFEDVITLVDYIKEIVYNKFRVKLEMEVRILGER